MSAQTLAEVFIVFGILFIGLGLSHLARRLWRKLNATFFL